MDVKEITTEIPRIEAKWHEFVANVFGEYHTIGEQELRVIEMAFYGGAFCATSTYRGLINHTPHAIFMAVFEVYEDDLNAFARQQEAEAKLAAAKPTNEDRN